MQRPLLQVVASAAAIVPIELLTRHRVLGIELTLVNAANGLAVRHAL
jgi:hypothetical protein